MQLETPSRRASWDGSVPVALDWRIVGSILVLGAVAASLNFSSGGVTFAAVAFVVLVVGGIAVHVVGERRVRRVATGLAARLTADDVVVEDVTRSSGVGGTSWTIQTSAGPVTVTGLALAPVSRVAIERDGVDESMDVADALGRLDGLASEWRRELTEAN